MFRSRKMTACVGALATLLVVAQTPKKGVMVPGPATNQGAVDTATTTRTTAVQKSSQVVAKPSVQSPVQSLAPGGGIIIIEPPPPPPDPTPIDTTGGTGTGTGTTTTGGTGTGTTTTGGTTTTTTTGGQVTSAGAPQGIWAFIQSQNPGDTTAGYPPDAPSGAQSPWTGGSTTSMPSASDLVSGMTNLTGTTVTTSGPAAPAGGCKCCGAPLETVLQNLMVPVDQVIDAYIAYQVWHIDHFSGNFWHHYHHSANTSIYMILGDVYGRSLPAGTASIPMVGSAYGCNIPQGTEVALTDGPPQPSAGAWTAPSACPVCGGHNDSWGEYLVYEGKVKVQLAVKGQEPLQKWVIICPNGHDQALPCDTGTTTTGNGTTPSGCVPPTCLETDCPTLWQEYRACIIQWKIDNGLPPYNRGGNPKVPIY